MNTRKVGVIFLVCLFFFTGRIYGEEGPYLEADLMMLEEESEIIICEGNVRFFDEDLQIAGDYATFNMEELSFFFSGTVSMKYYQIDLTSLELEGDLNTEDLLARGQVEIIYPEYFMQGDLFQLKNQEERAFLEGNTFLTGELGEMSGDRMDWDLDFTRLMITGSAQWDIPEGSGSAHQILYQDPVGMVIFTGDAKVYLSKQNFYGEEIIYSFKEGTVRIIKGGIRLPPIERE